jgi:DNA uptake protein ComE-like DNA-binding protein
MLHTENEMMTNRRIAGWVLEIAAMCLMAVLALSLLDCTENGKPNDQAIRQKSAEATREARKDAKELAAHAKVAAANAVEGANAAAQGVRDGLKQGDSGERVNINSASTAKLATLQGISVSRARAIVDGRPYGDTHELVDRGILTEKQYDQISHRIMAK